MLLSRLCTKKMNHRTCFTIGETFTSLHHFDYAQKLRNHGQTVTGTYLKSTPHNFFLFGQNCLILLAIK